MAKILQRLCLAVCLIVLSGIVAAQTPTVQIPDTAPGQAATQLPDGRWLLSGGLRTQGQVSAQLFLVDAASGQPSLAAIKLNRARSGHTATLMPDGRILVIGGVNGQGLTVADVEIVEPSVGISTLVGSLGLIPRAYHSATLLPDRRVLIAGGVDAKGQVLSEAELLNTDDLQVERFNARSEIARWQHMAQLLPSQAVLLLGGIGSDGNSIGTGELYDAITQRFGSAPPSATQLLNTLGQPPRVVGSMPSDGATGEPTATRIVVRFSHRMAPGSLNVQTVRLVSAEQSVAVNVVAAERGLLLFVTPRQSLKVAGEYRLVIDGAQDVQGMRLPKTIVAFRTADAAPAPGQIAGTDTPAAIKDTGSQAGSAISASLTGASAVTSPARVSTSTFPKKIDGALKRFSLPLFFEMNRGQHNSQVKFSTAGRGYQLHLAQTETVFDMATIEPTQRMAATFAAKDADAQHEMMRAWLATRANKRLQRQHENVQVQGEDFEMKRRRMRMQLLGANSAPNVVGMEPQASRSHYLDSQHLERSIKNIPHYGKVMQAEVYPGIDKIYYGNEGQLEYDWIVKPGVNPEQIAQKIEGADTITMDASGDVLISLGNRVLRQKKPVAYQVINGVKAPVAARYGLAGKVLRLKIGAYDKNLPLTIDPVIEYSASLGGASSFLNLAEMQPANDGSIFMLLSNFDEPFYSTGVVGVPCQSADGCPDADSYLIKVKPGGTELDFVTQFTGSSPSSFALRETPQGAQAILLGSQQVDALNSRVSTIAKLSESGDSYEFFRAFPGLYLGSANIALDSTGAIYAMIFAADPSLSDVPVFPGPISGNQTKRYGNINRGVIKLSADASSVVYQFLVPSLGLFGYVPSRLLVDNAGSAYVISSAQYQLPLVNARVAGTVVPELANYGDGPEYTYENNSFVFKVNPAGDALQYSTYLFRGSNFLPYLAWEAGVDAQGNLAVCGESHVVKYSPYGDIIYTYGAQDVSRTYRNPSCIMAIAPSGEVNFIDNSSFVANLDLTGANNDGITLNPILADDYLSISKIRSDRRGQIYIAGIEAAPGQLITNPEQRYPYNFSSVFLSKLTYAPILVTSPNPSKTDEEVTLTLANLGAVDGDASFFDGASFLGSAPVGAGVAQINIPSLTVGTHTLTGQFGAASYSTSHEVKLSNYPTTTTLSTTNQYVTENDPFTLNVQVVSNGAGVVPSGTVILRDRSVTLATAALDANGTAKFNLPGQRKGQLFYFTAQYSGDTANAVSVSPRVDVAITERAVPVSATVTSLSTDAQNTWQNGTILFTASISSANTPSGYVTFKEGVKVLGTAAVASGEAKLSLIGALAEGVHLVVAEYQGDALNFPSSSAAVTVNVVFSAPPTVAVAIPNQGSTILSTDPISYSIIAAPSGLATISSVVVRVNNLVIATLTAPPYSISFPQAPPGSYTVDAIATDSYGQTTQSAPITYTVQLNGTVTTYLHQDLTGNTIAATDVNGNLLYTESYRPYGERLENTAQSQATQPVGNRIWFHGKVQDEATGLQYFGARYYDPVIGRFMGVDPVGFNEGNIHSVNRFAYGNNNPYRYRDPDGNSPVKIAKAVYNVGKRAVKNGGDAKKAGKDEIANLVDNFSTLADGQLTIDDGFAVVDLVTGFGAEAKAATKGIPDNAVVCRGGSCKADNFTNGSGVTTDRNGMLDGVSVGVGNSVSSASKNIPHRKVGVTTAGNIRAAGGNVTDAGRTGNTNHGTVSGIDAKTAESLFKPNVVKNPNN